MRAVKYDEKTKTYSEPFEIDYPSLLSEDYDQLAECPDCHKKTRYGDMINCGNNYTVGGVWIVPVCPDCAKKIWEDQNKTEEKK